LGSNDVTNDIALGLRIPIEEAERLKVDPGRALNLKKKLDEIVEARLSDILELIETHLKKLNRNGLLPAGIIMVGGGAHIDEIEKLAKQLLKLPAKIFDPSASSAKLQIKDPGWVVAYGLCLFGLGAGDEESMGSRLLRQTRSRFLSWLKEFLP
jgi:cell division protein FtsA